jgi:hypothetical protein
MKINKKLNLIMPLETEEAGIIYIHSSPIGKEVFETYYAELGKVFSQCIDLGNQAHLILTAPQLAYSALKSIAIKENRWEGQGGIKFGLVNEIIRLTNVLIAKENGWESIPFDLAIKREILTEDEEYEILSAIVFFTAISKVAPKDMKVPFLEMVGASRNWEISSLDVTEYMNGLPILTKKENTGKKAKQSSIIS